MKKQHYLPAQFLRSFPFLLVLLFISVGCGPTVPKLEGTRWISEDRKSSLTFKTATIAVLDENDDQACEYKVEKNTIALNYGTFATLLTYDKGKLRGHLLGENVDTTFSQTTEPSAKEIAMHDPRVQRARDLVMREFNSRFFQSPDEIYTTEVKKTVTDAEDSDIYLQLKSPILGKPDISELTEADRLNNITWSASFPMTCSAYRFAPSGNTKSTWGDWSHGNLDHFTFFTVEKSGTLTFNDPLMEIMEDSYNFQTAKPVKFPLEAAKPVQTPSASETTSSSSAVVPTTPGLDQSVSKNAEKNAEEPTTRGTDTRYSPDFVGWNAIDSNTPPLKGEIFPDTRKRKMTPSDIKGWSDAKLWYAINEIYARRGVDFENKKIKTTFLHFDWYMPIGTIEECESHFNPVEMDNLKVLEEARVSLQTAGTPAAGSSPAQANSLLKNDVVKPIPGGRSPDGQLEFLMSNQTEHSDLDIKITPDDKGIQVTRVLQLRNVETNKIIDSGTSQNTPLSILGEAFFPEPNKILWSPDSKYVAVSITETKRGAPNLHFFCISNDAIKIVSVPETYPGSPIAWKSNTDLLLSDGLSEHVITFDEASLSFHTINEEQKGATTSQSIQSANATGRLSADDVSKYDLQQVRDAINTIYGRYGVEFPKKQTQEWLERQSWYHRIQGRTPDMAEPMFTADEKANVEILAARRDALRSSNTGSHANTINGAEQALQNAFLKPNGEPDLDKAAQYLTDSYKHCLAKAPNQQKEELRVAQRAWIKFSDYTETATKAMGKADSDLWNLEAQECIGRGNQLEHYYDASSVPLDQLQTQVNDADNSLTSVYNKVYSGLSESDKKNLTDDERAWIDYKEKNKKANAAVNQTDQGLATTVRVINRRIDELTAIYLGKSNKGPTAQIKQPEPEPSSANDTQPQSGTSPHADRQEITLWDNSLNDLREQAMKGDAHSQGILSILNQTGVSNNISFKEILAFALASSKQSNTFGFLALAKLYYSGQGVEKNLDKGNRLWDAGWTNGEHNLSNSNDVWAQYMKGVILLEGSGNHEGVAAWLLQAANQGNPVSALLLGYCYANGFDVKIDNGVAIKWYQKAAEAGFPEAEVRLGYCYLEGTNGLSKNDLEAVKWFRKASEQGSAKGAFLLAVCYNSGAGVEKDEAKAEKLYRSSFEQVIAASQSEFGGYLALITNGEDINELYLLAAEMGFADAQTRLGLYLLNNPTKEGDLMEAVKWLQKAADQGDGTARFNLAVCYETGSGVQKDLFKARDYAMESEADLKFYSVHKGDVEDLLGKLPKPDEKHPEAVQPEKASIKVKGFYIGMDFASVPALLKDKLAETGFQCQESKGADGNSQIWIGDSLIFTAVPLLKSIPVDSAKLEARMGEKNLEMSFIDADSNGMVKTIKFHQNLVNALFKADDLDATTFATQFLNAYKIPGWKVDDGMKSWSYTSPDGVKVSIDSEKCILIEKVPTNEERNKAFD